MSSPGNDGAVSGAGNGSTGNKILAIIIVIIFIMAVLGWIVAVLAMIMIDIQDAVTVFVPGALVFGFWGLVAYQLYTCPNKLPIF
jgi:hypothetical protein